MNPRSVRHKVATATISGLPGQHRYHGEEIPDTWFKVDVREILIPGVPLMYPNERGDQHNIEDTKGGNTVWDQKYLKLM